MYVLVRRSVTHTTTKFQCIIAYVIVNEKKVNGKFLDF